MWQWWGPLSPLDRARLRAELDILKPQTARPRTRRFAIGSVSRKRRSEWYTERKEWEKEARKHEGRLLKLRDTHKDRVKAMDAREFSALAPVEELITPAELDHEDRRERIVEYFTLLDNLADAHKHDFSSFLTYVKVSDGYIAPAFLVAGLMSRFEDDWTPHSPSSS
jgi:hypothetical protein